MLPKRARLRRQIDFERARTAGKHWRDGFLKINTASNALGHNRYGFVVSRRIGTVVKRNRLKRRLRALVRQQTANLAVGYDVIVIALPAAAGADYHELKRSLRTLLERAGLVQGNGTLA